LQFQIKGVIVMKYHFKEIEAKWQKYWAENQTFKAENNSEKPKYYVLDMFPYPSGAGLHVGHPLGYIASDIVARYKRHQGFNVLHPQGYDSFGLPAEQYAIQTGQHPAITTDTNIKRYREQLDKIGFSFDWSREVRTSDPNYYQWTQWIFIQLFESWYNQETDQAESICTLIQKFEKEGNAHLKAACDADAEVFTAEQWKNFSEEKKQRILLKYRLTYLAETEVNWCPALGTVLANDEIVNGVSERGGHPVIRKKMTQWSMRISAYAERLLQGLDTIDWTESLKESQRNWIGKSVGATVTFQVQNSEATLEVFTTRPDTIFGVSFMTLAPEHDLVAQITTPEQKAAVEAYVEATAKRSERERMADVKTISGVFTGAYAVHPFTHQPIPIWIGDYVLAGYGTGAVMAVPAGDERDYAFAKHFGIEIKNIFDKDISEAAFTEKSGFVYKNSDFLNGMDYKTAASKIIEELEKIGAGKAQVNYRLRDAVFSRQRYWGEPFPVYYVNGLPQMIVPKHLPIRLPDVAKYLPTEDGQPPLGNASVWAWDTVNNQVVENSKIDHKTVFPLELNTMPGWAGSSWYWMRYMDAHNENEFASQEALDYWQNVDLYIGGSEHATGHLLYARFWNKFLKDRGYAPTEEPFQKLINQGMILGMSAYVYRIKPYPPHSSNIEFKGGNLIELTNKFPYSVLVSKNLIDNVLGLKAGTKEYNEIVDLCIKWYRDNGVEIMTSANSTLLFTFNVQPIHVDLSCINDVTNELDIEKFQAHPLYQEYQNVKFILDENDQYIVGREVEKMSKSKYNVVNPDDICEEYGADTLRLYEMFLGPLEQAKPWNTAGISGVHSFLKKMWKLYHNGPNETFYISDEPAAPEALKSLHKTIKKVIQDIEEFSFNTTVSSFMICVNELTQLQCNQREVLEPLAVLLSPYAPHIAEELWEKMGHTTSISTAPFPVFDEKYLVESTKEYPISFNGKMRFTLVLPLDMPVAEIEKVVLAHEKTVHYLEGRTPKKVIIVPGKVVNIVG
jgi:leucyl-tRNA synthetase